MTFGMIVLQVNTHRLTESDFRLDVTLSIRWSLCHFTPRNKVLPPGKWKRRVCWRLWSRIRHAVTDL